ncbi:hypothetical protein D5F01_LYC14461 [Larimichthys crocea]|uniref:Uncharacterized protein n=1 Tax=Larimichthys crocea TaxID=215358 RepID=A0A6G0I5R2_LARCR|nr:hypothetical protein D5F01_LYC14461 [Larimichthys crocea]
MPETLQTNYQAISDMEQEGATVPWKKFSVHLAGKTNNAHQDFVARFKRTGQTEVDSPGRSDYILVFCPIVSRVGTDIGEALESTEKNNPGGKPIILVVMHHTFDPDRVIAESRRLVKNQNVKLTVDCLIYEGELLKCHRNDTAWSEVQNIFA